MSVASNQFAVPVVIDVRSAGEFAAGHVAGAIHLPLDQLAQRAATELPDHDRPMVLHCLSGVRSGMAAQWFLAQGYRQVRNGGSVSSVALQLGRAIERGYERIRVLQHQPELHLPPQPHTNMHTNA